MTDALIWIIVAVTFLLVLVRPKKISEAIWAALGALLLVLLRVIPVHDALAAVRQGTDVYLFLTGMMLLAELARREGFFDWAAFIALKVAKGSHKRLFAIVYAVGTVTTIFLSNDATAVVLTPAVLAVLRRARANPLPYLFICAFIANAASFVLPISNPANLVIYGAMIPALTSWLRIFGAASVAAIVVTFVVLRLAFQKDLQGESPSEVDRVHLSAAGRQAGYGIAGAGLALILASGFKMDLGLPTLLVALGVGALVSLKDRDAPLGVLREISWRVLPLVAGLFVLVEGIRKAGGLRLIQIALQAAEKSDPWVGSLSAAFSVAFASNVANNLPVGLIVGRAIQIGNVSGVIQNATVIGVDLGPNLSVTGSLATILWLLVLRQAGEDVSFWKFLRLGILVTPPALVLAVLASLLTGP